MILNALHDLYYRLLAADDPKIPTYGFSREKITFALVLSVEGEIQQVVDLRVEGGKRSRIMVVPRVGGNRTAGIEPFFLWDKTSYTLGAEEPPKGLSAKEEEKRLARLPQTYTACRDLHRQALAESTDPGAKAVWNFFASWNPESAASNIDNWEELSGTNMVFQLEGEPGYIHERPALKKIWERLVAKKAAEVSTCLVSGESAPVAMTHPPIKGVMNAQTSGAAIVSFNKESFCSYSRKSNDQGLNAPISQKTAFAYTTALNGLLSRESGRNIIVGDATTVFWAERDSPAESLMGAFLDPERLKYATKVNEDGETVADEELAVRVESILNALRVGRAPSDVLDNLEENVRFYLLGLAAPGKARLTVRFWHVSTLGKLLQRIGQHYRDLAIEPISDNTPKNPSLHQLLKELAVEGKGENIPPQLAAAMMQSVLTGAPYPAPILARVMERIRSDHKSKLRVTPGRAALIKAYLNRKRLITNDKSMEIKMSLNREEINTAYRMGRLFAVLEKTQQDALGGNINATIKDRYFGAASSSPGGVFPQLIRLTQHHIAKSEYGGRSDKLIEEILQDVNTFPPRLSLEDQGRFSLGYYHQRNDFYKKNTSDQESK